MRMVGEMKPHVRDRHELMLDKQNRGVITEQCEEERRLERRGLKPLDVNSLGIYRVDHKTKTCELISRHDVQENFYDWQTYVREKCHYSNHFDNVSTAHSTLLMLCCAEH